jgi:hypothetical protein
LIAGLYIMFLFVVLLLPQLYPVDAVSATWFVFGEEGLYFAGNIELRPICIGIVSVISLVGWILPFGLGGMHWFSGPKNTIEDLDASLEKR